LSKPKLTKSCRAEEEEEDEEEEEEEKEEVQQSYAYWTVHHVDI